MNVWRLFGGALGLALLVAIADFVREQLLTQGTSVAAATTEGFARAFLVGAGFAFTAAILVLPLIRPDRAVDPIPSSWTSRRRTGFIGERRGSIAHAYLPASPDLVRHHFGGFFVFTLKVAVVVAIVLLLVGMLGGFSMRGRSRRA